MRAALFVTALGVIAPVSTGASGTSAPPAFDVVLPGPPLVRHDLLAGAGGSDRRLVRAVRDLVEDRLDVDALPPDAPLTAWTLGDDLVAFTVDGHFAARAARGPARRWVFDDGTTLDGPMLSRPVRYLGIASRIGVRQHPITHRFTWHAGTDYAVPVGTPVRSVADGVVLRYQRSWTGGRILDVRHDDGSVARYMHLSGPAPGIAAGVRVHEGEVIALSGRTGRVTGPHLHFELRDARGTPIDPVVARWPGAARVDDHARVALALRRDLLFTWHADGARDWHSPLRCPPPRIGRGPGEDDDDEAVPPIVPVDRHERRSRARKPR